MSERNLMLGRLWKSREDSVSNAFLVAFRVGFGVWMTLRCLWYIASDDVNYVTQTELVFSFRGWAWVPQLPLEWIPSTMWVALAATVLLTVGAWTRIAAAVFALCFGYFFIIDAATWGNVDYLCVLFALILVGLPAGRRLSVDAARSGVRETSVPRWTMWLLQVQLGVVYFYAGVIKCTPDWLLRASPIRIFFERENRAAWLAPVLSNDAVVHLMAVGGCVFDLFIVPVLLWRRTRVLGFAAVIFFHGFNFTVLGLGIIPSLMIVMTLVVFSDPDTFEPWVARLEARLPALPTLEPLQISAWVKYAVVVHVVLQVLIPWRHLFYPGDARWNGDGQNFSWWMRSIYMDVDIKFWAEYGGQRVALKPLEVISREQRYMGKDPDLIVQYAKHEAAKLRAQGHHDVKIYAVSSASLNDRPVQTFIRPDVDLAALPDDFVPNDIVEPLAPYP